MREAAAPEADGLGVEPRSGDRRAFAHLRWQAHEASLPFHRAGVGGVADAAGRAPVQIVEEVGPPVRDRRVAARDPSRTARHAHLTAVGALDAEHQDSLRAKVQLGQRPAREPVPRIHLQLDDAVLAREVEEAHAVAHLEVRPAAKRPANRARQAAVLPPTAEHRPQAEHADDEPGDSRQSQHAGGSVSVLLPSTGRHSPDRESSLPRLTAVGPDAIVEKHRHAATALRRSRPEKAPMSDRLRKSIDTLRWLGAGVVVLPLVPLWLLADAIRVGRARQRR